MAHETGLPLVRGMYLEYPDQEPAYTFQQQYLFGKDLLVAPITAPGEGKPARKEVFLPAGQDWFDFFTGDFYAGGQTIVHECPLDRMPLFVRAGSILPMAPAMDYSDQKPVDPLTLDVYAGPRAAEFDLYEDDGTSLDYRAGAYARTLLRFTPEGAGNYTLRIGPAQGKFKGQLAKRRYVVQVHGLCKPDSVALNGRKLPEVEPGKEGDGWWWDRRERTITVRLDKPHLHQQGNRAQPLECRDLCRSGRLAEGLESPRPGAPGQTGYETQARGPGRRPGHQETAPRHS